MKVLFSTFREIREVKRVLKCGPDCRIGKRLPITTSEGLNSRISCTPDSRGFDEYFISEFLRFLFSTRKIPLDKARLDRYYSHKRIRTNFNYVRHDVGIRSVDMYVPIAGNILFTKYMNFLCFSLPIFFFFLILDTYVYTYIYKYVPIMEINIVSYVPEFFIKLVIS